MRSHAKAATAGSTQRQATGLGRFFRGAGAIRGASTDSKGSGAPSQRRFALAVLATMVSLIAVPAAVSSAAEPSGFELHKSFGPDGTGSSGFGSVAGVAVDHSEGTVYVLDGEGDALFKFDLEGNPVDFGGSGVDISGNELSGLAIGGFPGERQVAVDPTSHTIYLTGEETGSRAKALQAFKPNGEPALFSAGPGAGTNQIGGFVALQGVAVDANGSIYTADSFDNFGGVGVGISVYSSAGEVILPDLGANAPYGPANIAVDGNGVLYVLRNARELAKYTPSEYPVTAETTYTAAPELVDPNQARSVAVEPASNELYAVEHNPQKVVVYDEAGALQTSFAGPGEEGELEASGSIAVERLGGARVYVADNPTGGPAQVEIFRPTVTAPTIGATFATDVSADSARLGAQINPHTLPTTYYFEYGAADCATSACTRVPIPPAEIGSGHKLVRVDQQITGLTPATTYHYRVIAENSIDTVKGPDRTFTTQISGLGFELADDRAWEMVSPARKFAGSIHPVYLALVRAAADGNGLAYPSVFGSLDAEPEGNRAFEESTNLARRDAEGWHSKDITPPHTKATVPQRTSEYRAFSPDLSHALVEPYDSTLLSPQANERTIYLRGNTEPATYTPLVTGKEGFANVPPGTVFGEDQTDENTLRPLETLGSNSALTHVVFTSYQAGLVPGAPLRALYEWSAGQLQLINRLPAGEGGGTPPAVLGSGPGSIRHAVSEDGSRVFWSSGGDAYGHTGNGLTGLYARDTVGEETVRLDLAQAGASEAGDVKPAFQAASADGAIVFFTDSQQLTADAGTEGRDLYRCVVSFSAATPGCSSLTDISAIAGESAEVQDMSPAISEDGTHVYFIARGVLDAAANESGAVALAGEPNLYLWREGEGVRFIATLADGRNEKEGDADILNWGHWEAGTGFVSRMISAGSPSGRYFSFSSQRSLTGYDNHDAISDEPVAEIFRYDALADRLECVSCNPSGARPAGEQQQQLSSRDTLADPQSLLQGHWVAAILPQALKGHESGGSSFHRRRGVFDSGRVFFNAIDALVPADSNGQWDVYQYEPVGVGDCSASSGGASISRSAGGCVSLISSGTAEEEAAFLDASVSGDDAFFLTSARLSVTDEDSEADIYDARVNGVAATLAPSNECLGEACQPPALAPNDPTPASATFKGRGNVKATPRKRCAKGKRKVRRAGKARCVSRKGHKHKQKRAGKGRRAAR